MTSNKYANSNQIYYNNLNFLKIIRIIIVAIAVSIILILANKNN